MSFFLELLLLYLLLNWLPTLLLARGATRGEAAFAQIGFNLGGVITSLAIGVALDGRLRSAAIITTFVTVPVLLVVLARAEVEPMGLFVIVLLLGGAVLSAQAFLYASAPGLYPVSLRGMGAGAAVAAGRIGSIVGPQLGGFLKSAGHNTPQLLMDILPLVIAGSVASLTFAWMTRRPREEAAPHMKTRST